MTNKTWVSWLGILLLGLGIWIIVAALGTERVRVGDTVSLHYSLSLADGSVYYSSAGGEPLQYTLGKGNLLPGFEAALIGMQVGDSKIIRLPYSEAYGPYQPQLVMEVDRSELPEGAEPVAGLQLQTTSQGGDPLMMTITEVTESTVTLDANHPLAGQTLTFDIELMAIGNNSTAASNQLTWSWLIVALGVMVAGFVFSSSRNKRHSVIAGKRAAASSRHF